MTLGDTFKSLVEKVESAQQENRRLKEELDATLEAEGAAIWKLMDSMELAWGLIANAGLYSGGWDSQSGEWVRAAEKWRDDHWHASLDAHGYPTQIKDGKHQTDIPPGFEPEMSRKETPRDSEPAAYDKAEKAVQKINELHKRFWEKPPEPEAKPIDVGFWMEPTDSKLAEQLVEATTMHLQDLGGNESYAKPESQEQVSKKLDLRHAEIWLNKWVRHKLDEPLWGALAPDVLTSNGKEKLEKTLTRYGFYVKPQGSGSTGPPRVTGCIPTPAGWLTLTFLQVGFFSHVFYYVDIYDGEAGYQREVKDLSTLRLIFKTMAECWDGDESPIWTMLPASRKTGMQVFIDRALPYFRLLKESADD